ncbi:ATP synthase E chain-domain-containing protein [Corynascus novoguineensis]|uniref:ATP synthase F(0) complex subunit e, mitochondrial n=1 Tax=Corynascus novoguineensis TaxID=1126955 RepID=A0AAN7D0F1_9PEZI|nr:ATP synthase E chain-domain-containing protein [Corynascus novoguineensis]
MSSKNGVNVLRYSVLGLGVVYGFYHQRTINAAQKAAAAQREYEHKQELINKAKQAYAKTKQPAASSPAPSSGANKDDLEAFIEDFLNQK